MKKIILKRVSVMALAMILVINMAGCGSSSDDTKETKTEAVRAEESGNVIGSKKFQGSIVVFAQHNDVDPNTIYTITFLNSLDDMPDDAWDVSYAKDGSVMAWLVRTENTDEEYYDMYIAGEGGVDAPSNAEYLFCSLTNLNSINFNDCFYTGNTTNLYCCFSGCRSLQSIDLNGWNVSNVEDISGLFGNCESLTEIKINEWDVSNVKYMGNAFRNCSSLQSIDINDWDVSNATSMILMFVGCETLTSIDLSRWILPTDDEEFSCWGMLADCISLEEVQIGNVDTEDESVWKMLTDAKWGEIKFEKFE